MAQARSRHRSCLLGVHPGFDALCAHRFYGAVHRHVPGHDQHRRDRGFLRPRARAAGRAAVMGADRSLSSGLATSCCIGFIASFTAPPHGGFHAVHHSSEDLEWISAARFHPINIVFGTTLVDVLMLVAGIKPDVFFFLMPVHDREFGFRARQSRLDVGSVQIRVREPGVPPLASHAAGRRRRPELRHQLRVLRLVVRHFLHARRQATRELWDRRNGHARRPRRCRCSIP